MEEAIKVVQRMLGEVDAELDELSIKFSRTNPTSIYDASYRQTLVELKDNAIKKYNVLKDVKKALEEAENENH